jgi:hypothetical protein
MFQGGKEDPPPEKPLSRFACWLSLPSWGVFLMVHRMIMVVMAAGLLAPAARGGIPDLNLSTATMAAPGWGVSVYTLPNGGGTGLGECYTTGGVAIDAIITLTLLDSNADPIYLYPACDMWLETSLGGLKLCPGGSCADGGTDHDGVTRFSNPLFGGGYSDPLAGERCIVIINGEALASPGFDIQFNSPDINGDLVVNLTDVVIFASDYYGAYEYRSDFYFDGFVNLSDIVLLAQGMGAECP